MLIQYLELYDLGRILGNAVYGFRVKQFVVKLEQLV